MSFDRVSDDYAEKSIIQKNAAGKLVGFFDLRGNESILDVGCGPGHITAMLSGLTTGRVLGTDVSDAMVEEARSAHPGIEFRCVAAEDIDFEEEFDAVFCNSALQWFQDVERSLDAIRRALKSPGRLAVCCPATEHFSPWFERVIGKAAVRPEIAPVFAHWRSPWFFLPNVEAYRRLFERHGFRTEHISIEHEVNEQTVEEACGVYAIGAAVGFESPENYDCDVTEEYLERFNGAVMEEIERISEGGLVSVEFNRLYYVGEKG